MRGGAARLPLIRSPACHLFVSLSPLGRSTARHLRSLSIEVDWAGSPPDIPLVLMIMTLAASVAARPMVKRASGAALPVGRGWSGDTAGAGPQRLPARLRNDPASAVSQRRGPPPARLPARLRHDQ